MSEMDEGAMTYCYGFRMRMGRDVTFGDMRRTCRSLNAMFGPGHEFVPEAITEGGIEWISWPGKTAGMYKTLRLHCAEHDYPTLYEPGGVDVADEHVAYLLAKEKSARRMRTVLKALEGEPVWTLKELRVFAVALEREAGLRAIGCTFPRAADMCTESRGR